MQTMLLTIFFNSLKVRILAGDYDAVIADLEKAVETLAEASENAMLHTTLGGKVQFGVDEEGKPLSVEGWIQVSGQWIMVMFTIDGDVYVDGVKQEKINGD